MLTRVHSCRMKCVRGLLPVTFVRSAGMESMAGCERGYLCTVCGDDVEEITDSVLYLRYVLGEVAWDDLNRSPETHIRCDPILAQFMCRNSSRR